MTEQETEQKHTQDYEFEWGLCWKGAYVLSYGSNVSAGVAILFNLTLKAKIVSIYHVEPGRLLLVKAETYNFNFPFLICMPLMVVL